MTEQDSEDLAPGVPTGSGDGDTCARHVHDYTDGCMLGRTRPRCPDGTGGEWPERTESRPGDTTTEVAVVKDVWSNGEAYERCMGRWSRLLAPQFLHWLRAAAGLRWADVGCGS